MQIFRKKNRYDPQIFICCANIISQMNTFLSNFFSKTIKTNNYFFLVRNFLFLTFIWGYMRRKKFFSLERKFFLSLFLKFSLPINFFSLHISQKKVPTLFFKNMKTNNYFFLVRNFLFLTFIWGYMRRKKFFSLERKFFLSLFLKFSLPIYFFFSPYFSKKSTDTFFSKT